MKSLKEFIVESLLESKEEGLEPTKENILKLIKKAYDASVNDPENKKYGYTIDVRGVKGSETKENTNNEKEIGASSPKEFEKLAQELADHFEKFGNDAYFNAENYWNDSKENNAESDEKGVELRDGKIFTYGC